jgi:transposase-like protein
MSKRYTPEFKRDAVGLVRYGGGADKREGVARGYGSRREWHARSRRLQALKDRLAVVGRT